jgi:hypothetical protein
MIISGRTYSRQEKSQAAEMLVPQCFHSERLVERRQKLELFGSESQR